MIGHTVLNNKTMSILCRQLASAYEAGIPIIQALQVVGDNFPSRKVKLILYKCADDLMKGSTLSESLMSSGVFPELFVRLVSAGERSGKLDVILRDLSQYYEDMWRIRRTAISMMVYPVLQLVLGWFLGTFALGIVNQISFEERFNLSNYVVTYVQFQIRVCMFCGVVGIVVYFMKDQRIFRELIYSVFRWIWPFSYIIHKFSLARFFKSLALLYTAGISVIEALQRSSELLPSRSLQNDVRMSIEMIRHGATLEKAFKAMPWVGTMGQEMIAVGEQSGKLDESLYKLSEYFLLDAQQAVRVTTKILNVIIILVVGAIIGFIVISFYARLYGNLLNVDSF